MNQYKSELVIDVHVNTEANEILCVDEDREDLLDPLEILLRREENECTQ